MISDRTVIVCSDRFVDDKDILSVLKVIPRSLPDLSVHVDFSFFGMSQNLKCIFFSSEES